MAEKAKKKCSRPRCRNDAVSPLAKFCTACFKKNASRASSKRKTFGGGGVPGNRGGAGVPGNRGGAGVPGNRGNRGARGVPGNRGNRGAAGVPGNLGNSAATGVHGNRGNCGAAGVQGNLGNTTIGQKKLLAGKRSALLWKKLSREKFQKKCSSRGCRNDAASLRARYCTACFKKNAAACGRLRGNLEKGKKKCSGHGCRNDVQGSRWARFCPSCFKKNRLKVMSAAGHKSAFLGKNRVPALMVLRRLLQNRGIHVAQSDLAGKCHFVLRGDDACLGARIWILMDFANTEVSPMVPRSGKVGPTSMEKRCEKEAYAR